MSSKITVCQAQNANLALYGNDGVIDWDRITYRLLVREVFN